MKRTATNPEGPTGQGPARFADAGTVLLLVFLIGSLLVLAGFTVGEDDSVLQRTLSAGSRGAVTVACWMFAATGFGVWFLRWLPEELSVGIGRGSRLLASMGLGTAVMLWLDSLLGTLGLLQSPVVAWGVLGLGILLFVAAVRTSSKRLEVGAGDGWLPPLCWAAAPALAVLVVAASSAPGWLWQTEFGGYDALGYHLQLPREWLANGFIFTPTWNVYGALPSLVEGAYLHLMVVDGGPFATAIACQLLHATFAVLTAATTAAAVGRWFDRGWMGFAFALCLGVPWVLVVGSLAYDEMAASLMLATAMLLLVPRDDVPVIKGGRDRITIGIAAGVLAAAACGAKLTAVGFVGLPIGYLLVRRLGKAHLQWVVPAALVAGTLVLAPWLARNAMATGNPTFPFLSGVFGTGHFSPEQAQRFQAAHASDLGPVDRIVELWRQVIAYGFGDPPYPGEPWRPQWSLLPLLTGAGLVVGVLKPRRRRLGVDLLVMIGVATLFWLSATHLKSRFLVPTIPLMIAAVLLLLPTRLPPLERGRPLLGVALLAWCLLPLWLFKGEKLVRTAEDGPSASLSSMMVGRMDLVTGLVYSTQAMQEEDPEERMRLIAAGGFQTLGPLLAPEERVLALGNATPFLSTRGYEYATVWDEHPVAVLLERHPGDPDAVVEGLRARGTTLLLVNFPMLQRWLESGWLDPRLDPAELQTLVERLDLQVRWENGEVLYRVPPPGVPPTASDQGAPGS